MTYTKIKFYIIVILKKYPRMNNKKIKKGGLKNLRKGGPGVDVTELQWAGWRPVMPPHSVDNVLAFEEGGDSVSEFFPFFLFISQHLLFYTSNDYSS